MTGPWHAQPQPFGSALPAHAVGTPAGRGQARRTMGASHHSPRGSAGWIVVGLLWLALWPVYGVAQGDPQLRQVQERLKAAGWDSGPLDGAWGPRAQAALRRYQAAHHLPVTGQPDAATLTALGLTTPAPPPPPAAQETKPFVAFSMQVAQARVAEAVRQGQDFRQRQPELFALGGITRPWAVVLDATTGDWILVGERDPQSPRLTLDDWVVALRARFLHAQEDPGVTIDPISSEKCQKAGTAATACLDSTRQVVRFFGGIANTRLGQVCYEADWFMKKLALALEQVPVSGLKSHYTLQVEHKRQGRSGASAVGSRFWFYPLASRVHVLAEVLLLEPVQMGVFTEVLYAELEDPSVQRMDFFKDYPAEGFARSFSEHYDAVARVRPVLETLRSMTRLAALAKGLAQTKAGLPVAYYLHHYPLQPVPTPRDVEILRVTNRTAEFTLRGGAILKALVQQPQGGDAQAFHHVVLQSRPSRAALRWDFDVAMQDGRVAMVQLPEASRDPRQMAALFAEAAFLQAKQRYAEAIERYSTILQRAPDVVEAYHNRGLAYAALGRYAQAIADYTQAIALEPRAADLYIQRGRAYGQTGQPTQALADFTQALEVNPRAAEAYTGRAVLYAASGQATKALADLTQALEINPHLASAYYHRGQVQQAQGQQAEALADYTKALEANPRLAEVYLRRGSIYAAHGQYTKAVADFTRALEVNPLLVEAYHARALAYMRTGQPTQALTDTTQALQLNPRFFQGYYTQALIYEQTGRKREAAAAYQSFLATAPSPAPPPYATEIQRARQRLRDLGS